MTPDEHAVASDHFMWIFGASVFLILLLVVAISGCTAQSQPGQGGWEAPGSNGAATPGQTQDSHRLDARAY